MADRLDDLYSKLTTGTLQELLGWVTLCSNLDEYPETSGKASDR
jgi:hypothetical protein